MRHIINFAASTVAVARESNLYQGKSISKSIFSPPMPGSGMTIFTGGITGGIGPVGRHSQKIVVVIVVVVVVIPVLSLYTISTCVCTLVTVPQSLVTLQHHPSQPLGESGLRLSQPALEGLAKPTIIMKINAIFNTKLFGIISQPP